MVWRMRGAIHEWRRELNVGAKAACSAGSKRSHLKDFDSEGTHPAKRAEIGPIGDTITLILINYQFASLSFYTNISLIGDSQTNIYYLSIVGALLCYYY